MSRSRRKIPIVGVTTCRSEREDKKLWHQCWRTRERTALSSASLEVLDAHFPVPENQISNVWRMDKDGHHYWPAKRQPPRWIVSLTTTDVTLKNARR